MACFIAPMTEAIATSIVQKKVGKEKAKKWRLDWLNKLLWGGTALLVIEHIWYGEVVAWPPFLTVMENPAGISVMLHEVATKGIIMAAAVTALWAIMVKIAMRREKAVVKEVEGIEVSLTT